MDRLPSPSRFLHHLTALLLCTGFAGAMAEEENLATCRFHPGIWLRDEIVVKVGKTGATEVARGSSTGEPSTYRTTLSEQELAGLQALAKSVGFFATIPPEIRPTPTDQSETTLTIANPAEPKTVTWLYRPEFAPLSQFFWRLVFQAKAVQEVESNGDIYTAIGAVTPSMASGKALQPASLRQPLIAYVGRERDSSKLRWALEGLAAVTSPEEFLGVIATAAEESPRQDLLLVSIPGAGNIPKAHHAALCHFYFSFVRENYGRQKTLSAVARSAVSSFISILGDARYEAAIPFFVRLLESAPSFDADLVPLAKMGDPGLRAVLPFLTHKNPIQRAIAADLLAIASRGNPKSIFANPYPAEDYGRMLPLFKEIVLPKLDGMARDEPDANVRQRAGEAAKTIREEIAK